FLTTDAFGRQRHSFQYMIGVNGWPDFPYPPQFESLIRGEEIHLTGDNIRIRNPWPSDPDHASGGWGAIRGVVPYQLDGAILSFSVPLRLLSDDNVDGNFLYMFSSAEYG